MSRPKPPVVKCPWCGRDRVPLVNSRLGHHLSPGGVRCVGSGVIANPAHVAKPGV